MDNGISLNNTGVSNGTRSFENIVYASTSGATSDKPIIGIAGALSPAQTSSRADSSSLARIIEHSHSSRSCSLTRSSDQPSSSRTSSVLSRSVPESHATSLNRARPSIKQSTSGNSAAAGRTAVNWTTDETKYLLDQYCFYIDEVGPMKLFRTKKDMWLHLAQEMTDIFDNTRAWDELSKRVETIIERKKLTVNGNRKSGATRTDIEYEEEINKIAALADSIEPEVLRGVNFVHYKKGRKNKDEAAAKKPRWDKPNKKGILNTLSETMLSIASRRSDKDKLKEERRKKMHEEKMELLSSLKRRE